MLSRTTGAHVAILQDSVDVYCVCKEDAWYIRNYALKFAHDAKKLKIIWRMYISCDTFYYNSILHSNEHNYYL